MPLSLRAGCRDESRDGAGEKGREVRVTILHCCALIENDEKKLMCVCMCLETLMKVYINNFKAF